MADRLCGTVRHRNALARLYPPRLAPGRARVPEAGPPLRRIERARAGPRQRVARRSSPLLMKRVVTAAALVPIVLAVVYWANFWVFFAVVWIVASLCYREYA